MYVFKCFCFLIDKFLCKNEGGGGVVPYVMSNLFDIDRGFLISLFAPIF
jgi:hypothetical protein